MLTIDDAGFPKLGDRPLKLPPKERAVLALLARRRPGAVSKHEFADAAWQGRLMSDESLARCVSQLRRTLAPFGLTITSVYGTGYRLDEQPAPMRHVSAQETYLHARQMVQQRTPAAVGRAIALLRDLCLSEPQFMPARVALAEALATAVGWGQLATEPAIDEGLRALDQARQHQPAAPGLDAAHGALLDMAWRFDEAALAFELALRQDTQNPDTLMAYARHLLLTGQAQAAVQQLRLARQLSPHTAMLRIFLSRALAQAGQGQLAMAEADAAVAEHPGQLVLFAFALSMRAHVEPSFQLEAAARRLSEGADTPPFAWTVLSFVLARLGRREPALDIIDSVLLCSRTSSGEATLYAAPLAALGEWDRAADLLERAYLERSGMLAMVLRDPAHAAWLPQHAVGQRLLRQVFGAGG